MPRYDRLARHEYPREDLVRDAVAFVDRAEFSSNSQVEPVFVGFRADGSASIFFGQDQVLQFNADAELRRVYWQGQLYRAERGHLVAIHRHSDAGRLRTVAEPLSPEVEIHLLTMFRQKLAQWHSQLDHPSSACAQREIRSSATPVIDRLRAWLAKLPDPIVVPRAPYAGR